MSKMKKLFAVILTIAMVLGMCAVLAGCNNEETPETTGSSGEAGTYTISVKSQGGLPLEKVAVSVYADDTLSDLKGYDETDENGEATMELDSDKYVIALSGLPAGYTAEASYNISGSTTEITLTSSLIEGESLAGASLGLGDVMYDFEVALPDGGSVKLSDMLAEKKMVLLNFWFSTCGPCANEFPYMEEAYQQYQDTVGVIALDPLEENTVVAGYQSSMGLTFPMAACPATWSATFNISGYPTSVIIDRYGVICLIEVGGITSLRPFTSLFEAMTAEDYEQKIYTSISELVTNVKPTETMDTPENVAALLNNGEIPVTYHAEEDEESAEYAWPFIATEKNGEQCLKATNQDVDSSFAVLYANVTLKAGEALGLDYLVSSETGADTFVVIVNGDDIFTISGVNDPEKWESCYPVVADADGEYEIALFYLKDEGNAAGDDTVYIKNVRIVSEAEIDTATYLPREAATDVDGFTYNYVDIVLNSQDGYYHVGSENGPLLLADLMGYTQFDEEETLWEKAYNGEITLDGVNYLEQLEQYCNYASNAKGGVCTVNQELYDLLQVVDKVAGFDDADDKEWMKLCKYFQAYGTDGKQLEDPVAGLATFSAYTATEGKDVASNYFYYDRIIMPRGLLAKFVPKRSGVYRITSENESQDGVDAWIFNENREELLVYEQDERLFNDSSEVSMVYYMEAGKPYFIDIAFWDPYEVGYIYYDIEYLGAKLDHFRLCSPGPFTYDSDATGDTMYHVIHGGIKAVLGDDGIYYADLGDGKKGSPIYADFTGFTSLFNTPIATVGDVKGMIDKGGFDFSKNEEDQYILAMMANNDNDPAKTDEYLKTLWGEDFEANYEIYQVEDVYAGKFHGEGEDMTAQISEYLSKMIKDGHEEREGCVIVTEELAEILQMLMDKYTFKDVDQGWLKLCYYYDYLGPEG